MTNKIDGIFRFINKSQEERDGIDYEHWSYNNNDWKGFKLVFDNEIKRQVLNTKQLFTFI